jgi:hypothetical protein
MIVPAPGRIARHFRRLVTLSEVPFVLRVTLESIAAGIVALIVLMPFQSGQQNEPRFTCCDVVIIAPILETLLLQALPVRIAQIFTRRFSVHLLVGWLPFAALHFFKGFEAGIAAGVVGGYYVAFTYAVWVRHSHRKAIIVTIAMHALGNLIVRILDWLF